MGRISLIHLGKPQYREDNQHVDLTVAVTFNENINPDEYYIELRKKGEKNHVKLSGELKDAIGAFEDEKALPPSMRHWHVKFENLDCGAEYTYRVRRRDKKRVYVLPANDQSIKQRQRWKDFKAPPAKGSNETITFSTAGDTEALDYFRSTKLDELGAKLAKLNFDQRKVTSKVYRIMGEHQPNLFLHLGDYFNAEGIHGVSYRGVEKLNDLRYEIACDHHEVVREGLAGMVSAHVSDDHDDLWNGYNAETVADKPKAFENTRAAVNEFWPVPNNPDSPNPGLYYQMDYGDLSVWFLHARAYHQPGKSLFGEEQLQWFESSLKASTAKAKIVAWPFPPAMGKNPDEDMRSQPAEWDHMEKICAKNGVTCTIGADTHAYGFMKTRVHLPEENRIVVIPHYMVGTLGGKPQQMTDKEAEQLPKPLIPEKYEKDYEGSRVEAYYTPARKTGLLPDTKKRAYLYDNEANEGKWIGREVKKNAYGFMDGKIDFEGGKMCTSLFLTKQKEGSKRPFFEHTTEIPLIPESIPIESKAHDKPKLKA